MIEGSLGGMLFYHGPAFPTMSKILLGNIALKWLQKIGASARKEVYDSCFVEGPPTEMIQALVSALCQKGDSKQDCNILCLSIERKANPAMGASKSRPVTSKLTVGEENDRPVGENDRIKYVASSVQGRREDMEDAISNIAVLSIIDLDGSDSTSFFGVYDGHGGADVALYCKRQFHIELVNDPHYHENLATVMQDVCSRIDLLLQESNEWREEGIPQSNGGWIKCLSCWPTKAPIGPQLEGSTACVALVRNNQITVGNVGDSRCILSVNGQVINLSTDHKHATESQRIQGAVGHVTRDRVNGIFGVSRAIGDLFFKRNKKFSPAQQIVTCIPDTVTGHNNDTEFLLIASDGIWDVMSSQAVVDFRDDADLPATCETLLDHCLGTESATDNMTVILVQFKTWYRAGLPPAIPNTNPNPTASASTTTSVFFIDPSLRAFGL